LAYSARRQPLTAGRPCKPPDQGWYRGPDPCQRACVLAVGHLALVMVTLVTAAAVRADTGTTPVEVQFDGPEGCSGANAFLGSLLLRTQRVRAAGAGEPHATVQVRLKHVHGRVTGELRLIDDRGGTDTRKVQGANCDEVVQALSLTTALALDPSALLSAPPADPSTTATASTASTTGAAATAGVPAQPPIVRMEGAQPVHGVVPTAAVPSARSVPEFEWSAGLVGLAVLSGGLNPGLGLAARKNFARDGSHPTTFRPTVELAAAYIRNDVVQSPQSAVVALAAMGLTGCPMRATASLFRVQPCAFLLAGWLSATGHQVAHVYTVDRAWLSTGLTARAAVLIGRGFSLDLEGGINLSLLRRRFFSTLPSNVVADTSRASPLVRVGLSYAR